MKDIEESVRRVVHGLLDMRIAVDFDQDSEAAVALATVDLLEIPGVIAEMTLPSGERAPDLTVLLSGAATLTAQLIMRLAEATDASPELVVRELREWVDETILGSSSHE